MMKSRLLFPRTGRNTAATQALLTLMILLLAVPAPPLVAQQSDRTYELHANSPAFWKLVSRDAKLQTVATGFGFTEGPVWDPAGFLYVSDETLNKIFRLNLNSGKREEVIALGDPDGNTYDTDRRLIDCASVLRAIVAITPDAKYQILADRFEGKRFNSPNDVVLGPDGALYFTDPTLDLRQGQKQEIPFQGVYRLDSKGNVRLLTKDLTQPNGLAFSPDGKRFYVDNSEQRNIRVYDFKADGSLTHGRLFGEEPGGKSDGVPDGIKVDRSGDVFVTGPKGIWVWSENGTHLGTITLPEQPANLTWGGPDLQILYITATTSVYRLKTTTQGFMQWRSRLPSMISLGTTNQLSDAGFNELVRDRAFADHRCRLKYYSGNFCSPLTVKTAEATETEVPGCPPPI